MKPKGLMVIHQFRPISSGAELQAERIAIKLSKLGHSMQVLTQHRDPDSLEEENLQGVQVHRVMFPLAYWIVKNVGHTFRYLVQQRQTYDVIHVHQAFGHAVVSVVVARIFGKKCIIKVACGGSYGDLRVFSDFLGFKWALRILHQVDVIVAISRDVEKELLDWGFSSEQIEYIPNAVNTEYFQRKRPLPDRGKVRFILVGRRTPQKGIDVTLKAVKLLVENGLNNEFEIRFLGLDYPEHDYRVLAHEFGIMDWVEFLPFSEKIIDEYHNAHCLLLPSRGEGLSNVILEASAMELAVIATPVSGTIDVIEDGKNGILVPINSHKALADAMLKIIQQPDLAQLLGENARQNVILNFSLNNTVRKYSNLYRRLCF